jgi:hypothetical protein
MLGSITPLGERGHARRWPVTAGFYLLGSVLGGCVAGGLAGLLSEALRLAGLGLSGGAVLLVSAGLCVLGVAVDVRLGGLRLPSVHRQVNEDWLARYRGWVIGVGFGFQLGLGVVTIVTTAAVYVAFATALLSGSAAAGLLIGAVFGLARGLPLLAVRRVQSLPRLRAQHQRLSRWEPRANTSTVVAQAAVALAALGLIAG